MRAEKNRVSGTNHLAVLFSFDGFPLPRLVGSSITRSPLATIRCWKNSTSKFPYFLRWLYRTSDMHDIEAYGFSQVLAANKA
jgi:hypothetical protein